MKVKLLSSYNGEALALVREYIIGAGCVETDDAGEADIIICPDYEEYISPSAISKTKYGALIFHPSPLPVARGKNAIKTQYKNGDRVGGGTWFWAGKKFDTGDICEQELVIIDSGVRPSEYYNKVIIPVMVRTLGRAILNIKNNIVTSLRQ